MSSKGGHIHNTMYVLKVIIHTYNAIVLCVYLDAL